MPGLRKLDAFVKPRHELRSQSAVGGLITLVAATTTALLFLGQISTYLLGNPQHHLQLSKSTSVPMIPLDSSKMSHHILSRMGKIPLTFLATFPHLKCSQLDITHDSASLSSGELKKVFGDHSITMRKPTHGEMSKMGIPKDPKRRLSDSCTVEGRLMIPIVAGQLSIGMTKTTWADATMQLTFGLRSDSMEELTKRLSRYNTSHYIDHVRFGTPFPYAADAPLEGRMHAIDNSYGGIALEEVAVKLIPTIQSGVFFGQSNTYQMSVTDHTVQPSTMVASSMSQLPGLTISYDFTPLAVHHSGGRDNFLVFLSSIISIVGGVFVTVGLLTGCLVHSVEAVAKKID